MKPEKCFERFFYAMEGGRIYMEEDLSFKDVCMRLNVSLSVLDGYLHDNFGLSGDQILEIYRKGIPLAMYRGA